MRVEKAGAVEMVRHGAVVVARLRRAQREAGASRGCRNGGQAGKQSAAGNSSFGHQARLGSALLYGRDNLSNAPGLVTLAELLNALDCGIKVLLPTIFVGLNSRSGFNAFHAPTNGPRALSGQCLLTLWWHEPYFSPISQETPFTPPTGP
jgi:hypothetical protein